MKKENAYYVVEGGRSLSGTLSPSGSKNAALPILAATLLTDKEVVLSNVPDIRDVRAMLFLLETLGVLVEDRGNNSFSIRAESVNPETLDIEECRSIRASILLAGPLLARTGKAVLPPPGGDVIGKRRLDTHFLALEKMGAAASYQVNSLSFTANRLKGCSMLLDEPSVTATENAIMAASLASGITTIYNSACEPNVQDLCVLLTSMGAEIEGIGTNRLTVHGSDDLLNGAEHSIVPDHIEIGSFIGLASICGGEILLPGVPENIIAPIMNGLSKLGVHIEVTPAGVKIDGSQPLEVQPDRGGAIPTIYDAPWPGFSPDLTSTAVVVATQSSGISLIFEKMFESRLFFVDKLVSMGASIIQCDPHRVVISGPAQLRGTEVSSPDIRAGMALLTAALCAEGRSIINNVHQIERGYSDIVERINALGASIRREIH